MDRAGLIAALLCAALATGCDNGEVTGPDAMVDEGDGGVNPGDPDARTSDVSSMEFELYTDPELPSGDLGDPWDATISEARFRLEDLRVVGDAAILNEAEFEMEFTDQDRFFLEFSPAAPGMYATFIGRIDYFRIEGTVDIGDGKGDMDFEIQDNPPPSTTFVVLLGNTSVAAGETVKLRVDIDLEEVVNEIDWTSADEEDGELELTDGQKMQFRDDLAQAFDLD